MYGVRVPDLPWRERLPDLWRDIGFAAVSPMGGYVAFSWQEVEAFSRTSGHDVSKVEAAALIDMSRAFAERSNDTNPLSIEPMEALEDD